MLEEALHVPARLAEIDRQPVEQFGMRRQLARDAEVAAGAHDARAEHLLPEAVDGDARRQRMLRPQQPLGEAEPVARQVRRHRRQGVRRRRLHLVAALVVLAAEQHVRLRLFGTFLHDVGDGAARLELASSRCSSASFLAKPRRGGVERCQPPVEKLILLAECDCSGRDTSQAARPPRARPSTSGPVRALP